MERHGLIDIERALSSTAPDLFDRDKGFFTPDR